MADLVAEFTNGTEEIEIQEGKMSSPKILAISAPSPPPPPHTHTSWEIYADGVANQNGFGVEIVLVPLEKITMERSLRLGFPATNNKVEYEALLA